jgi:RHS repeat-associated protein
MQKLTYPMRHGTSDTVRREMTLTYDIASRIDSLKYDDAQTGQMFASNPVYNAASQTESLTIGSPSVGSRLTESYTYDAKTGLLTTQKVTRNSDSAVFLDLKYNYTLTNDAQNNGAKTGQLTGITDQQNQTRNRAYEYDKLGRLKKAKGGTGAFSTPDWYQDYVYDRYGNRTSVTKTGGGSNIPLDGLASLSYNTGNNRVTSANFEYDPAGNQTKAVINASGAVQQYRYDAAGRLAQVLDGGGATLATYSYGASNQRLMSVEGAITTYYGWDGGQIIAEYAPSGSSGLLFQTGYVYLGGRLLATVSAVAGSGTRFHHPDRLGTNVVTDQSNGELVTKQMGMPYGTQQPLGAFGGDNSWQHSTKNNPSKKRFTSYDRSDATGLDYAVNRFYSSAQGRFTQVDPIGMEATSLEDPQSLNLYSYCGNDPINYVDPDGLFFKWLGKAFKFLFKVAAIALFVVAMVLLPGEIAGFVAWKGWLILMGLAGAAGLAGWHNGKLGTIVGTILTAGLAWKGNALTPNTFPKGSGVGGVNNFLQQNNGNKPLPTDYGLIRRIAIGAIQAFNARSRARNREYGGEICRDASGRIYATRARRGTVDGFRPLPCPTGETKVGQWHTHGAYDPNYDSENFSGISGGMLGDVPWAERHGVPLFLGTPSGRIRVFIPDSSIVQGPGLGRVSGGRFITFRERTP